MAFASEPEVGAVEPEVVLEVAEGPLVGELKLCLRPKSRCPYYVSQGPSVAVAFLLFSSYPEKKKGVVQVLQAGWQRLPTSFS